MEKNKDHMDNELFDALSDYSTDAPGIDWNGFQAHQRKKRRRVVIWWWLLAGCLLTGIVAGYVFYASADQEFTKPQARAGKLKEKRESSTMHQQTEDLTPADQNVQANPDIKSGEHRSTVEKQADKTNKLADKQNDATGYGVKNSQSTVQESLVRTTPEAVKENDNRSVSGSLDPELVRKKDVKIINPHEGWDRKDLGLKARGLTKHEFIFGNEVFAGKKVRNLNPEKIRVSHVFVQFQAGPAFNFPSFSLSESGKAFIHKDYAGIRKASETGLLGYGFQLTAGNTFKKLDIAFGLGLSNTRVFGHYDFTYSEKPIMNTDGSIVSYNPTTPTKVNFKSSQNYTFVEIPLYIDYQLYSKKRIKTYLHAGMLNQFLKQISGEQPNALFMNYKDQLSTENFRSYSANIELGCRLAYQYNSKIQLAITPVYRKNFGFYQAQSYYMSNFNAFCLQFSLRKYL